MRKIVKIPIVFILILVISLLVWNAKSGNGKENGNVSNGGLAIERKGVTYYNKYEKGIFEVKGNSEKRLTDETAYSITIYDNKLYYMTVADFNHVVIKYVNLSNDGNVKNVATIYTSVSKFFIEDGFIYYFTNEGSGGICRMDVNGTNETLIVKGGVRDFHVCDQKLYYINDENQICEFFLKKQENVILKEEIFAKKMQIVGQWIYYYDEKEDALFRVSKNGEKQELVSVLVHNEIYNVCGKYVYYLDEQNSKIARMKLKKSNQCDDIVSINISTTRINIAGDVLYYLDKSKDESQNYQMHRVRMNGEMVQDIEY